MADFKKTRTRKVGKPKGIPRKFYVRPGDRSLAAYKQMINSMMINLTGKPGQDMTEKEWERDWRAFWKKASPKTGL